MLFYFMEGSRPYIKMYSARGSARADNTLAPASNTLARATSF